ARADAGARPAGRPETSTGPAPATARRAAPASPPPRPREEPRRAGPRHGRSRQAHRNARARRSVSRQRAHVAVEVGCAGDGEEALHLGPGELVRPDDEVEALLGELAKLEAV